MSGFDITAVSELDEPVDVDARRRRAVEEAGRESVGLTPSAPGIAVRRFGRGCLVIAIAGTFDDAARARLDAVTRDLSGLATAELVVCTSHLVGCDRRLARLLSRLRLHHLMAGARVELHDPPPELTAELGQAASERFTVRDGAAPRS